MPVDQWVNQPTHRSRSMHSLASPPFPPSSFLSRGQGLAPKPISFPFQSPRSISYFLFLCPFLPSFSRLLPPSVTMLHPHFSPLINSQSHPLPNPLEKPVSTIPFPFSLIHRLSNLSCGSQSPMVPNPQPTCLYGNLWHWLGCVVGISGSGRWERLWGICWGLLRLWR